MSVRSWGLVWVVLVLTLYGVQAIDISFTAGEGDDYVRISDSYDTDEGVSVSEQAQAEFGDLQMTDTREISGSGEQIKAAQSYSGSGGYTGQVSLQASGAQGTIKGTSILTPVYFDSVSNIQVTASTIEVTCSATKTGVENSYVITQINGVGGGTGTFGGEVASYAGHSTGSSQNGHVSGIITSTADANGYSITKNSNNNWPDNVLDMRAQTVGGIATPYGLLALYTTPSLGLQNAVDAASSGDTIIAGPGTYRENVVIDKSLDLSGAGSGNTIVDGGRGSGGPSGRVFEISPSGATVTLSGMKIQNGFALWDWGGGIYNSGSLTINDAIISGNIGQAGGGGIFNSGTLTMNGGKITGNAGMVGGGIYNSGFLTINGATILGNHAAMSGGGVANCGTLTLTDTIISGNTPDDVFP